MASTSQLEVYNCTPQLVSVQINTIQRGFKVEGDTDASEGYYPASNNTFSTPTNVQRVLTNADDGEWTRINTVTIAFENLPTCTYTRVEDPPSAAYPGDLRLWIFEQFIALSQGNLFFNFVKPDPPP